jgi:transcriptional regulator with XRE-family HTH domain
VSDFAANALRPEIRAVFKQLRRERNLTQAQLAVRTGMATTGGAICVDAVSDLETGRHASNPATVEAVLKVLRVTMDGVLERANQQSQQS